LIRDGPQSIAQRWSRKATRLTKQVIDRLRLIHSEKRKTVYGLCKIPLDIQVDELVMWKQLTGDRRLSDAWQSATRGVGMRCRWRRGNWHAGFRCYGKRQRSPSAGLQSTPQRLLEI
jgi:hypothetical protein